MPVKRSHTTLFIGLGLLVVALIARNGYFFFRKSRKGTQVSRDSETTNSTSETLNSIVEEDEVLKSVN
jgi:hypothetical protein